MKLDVLRGAIRPLATIVLLAAFVLYAKFDGDAFERVKEASLMVIAYWFGTRSK